MLMLIDGLCVMAIGARNGIVESCLNSDRVCNIHFHTYALGKCINTYTYALGKCINTYTRLQPSY